MKFQVTEEDPFEIAIVGMGPRGLSVLERLLANLAAKPAERPVRVFVIDPGEPGAGRIWRTSQPEWFLMNTPCGEVTLYSGAPDGGPARAGAGPSLHEWVSSRPDPRWAGATADDFLPRVVYGEYLTSLFASLLANLPPRVSVHPVRAKVIRAQRQGPGYLLSLDRRPLVVAAHKVVLTTGHPRNLPGAADQEFATFADARPGLLYLQGDSAADMELDSIGPDDTVGIVGMGLSFYDIVSALTEGRGGQFVPDGGELRYLPSGREPRIAAGSRSGLPMPARGRNQKAPHYRYQPRFITEPALSEARRKRLLADGNTRLRFAEDVLPLIKLEVEHVYYQAHLRKRDSATAANRFGELDTAGTRDKLLTEFGLADLPPLDFDKLARPFASQHFESPDQFHDRLLARLRQDIAEASLGNVDGPLKAALDILRDLRGAVRSAVEFSSLHPVSQRDEFLTAFGPVNSLLSVGPPTFRVAQLGALIRAGVVTIVGPGTRFETDADCGRFVLHSPQVEDSDTRATVLLDARIPQPSLREDDSALTRQLLRDGLVTEYVNYDPAGVDSFRTGGLAVTRAPYHVVDIHGRADGALYALGIPTENPRWFTSIGNDRPGPFGGYFKDADSIANDLIAASRRTVTAVHDGQTAKESLS